MTPQRLNQLHGRPPIPFHSRSAKDRFARIDADICSAAAFAHRVSPMGINDSRSKNFDQRWANWRAAFHSKLEEIRRS